MGFSLFLPLLLSFYQFLNVSSEKVSASEVPQISKFPDLIILDPSFSSSHRIPISKEKALLRALQFRRKLSNGIPHPVAPRAKALPSTPILARAAGIMKIDHVVNAQNTAAKLGVGKQRILVNGGVDEPLGKKTSFGEEKQRQQLLKEEVVTRHRKGGENGEERGRRRQQPSWSLRIRPLPSSAPPLVEQSLDPHNVWEEKQSMAETASGNAKPIEGSRQIKQVPTIAVRDPKRSPAPSAPTFPLTASIPPPTTPLRFYYTPSNTAINQDFAFASNTPGLACAYGMPIPLYNTPRKQCVPYHPLCGIAFTCVMDVHAMDTNGMEVDGWWTASQQPPSGGQSWHGTEQQQQPIRGAGGGWIQR